MSTTNRRKTCEKKENSNNTRLVYICQYFWDESLLLLFYTHCRQLYSQPVLLTAPPGSDIKVSVLGALRKVKYSFIAITPRSTLTLINITCHCYYYSIHIVDYYIHNLSCWQHLLALILRFQSLELWGMLLPLLPGPLLLWLVVPVRVYCSPLPQDVVVIDKGAFRSPSTTVNQLLQRCETVQLQANYLYYIGILDK